jgi:hypothetical protein
MGECGLCAINHRVDEFWRLSDHHGEEPTSYDATAYSFGAHSMLGELRGHGMGRHSADEVENIGKADLIALSDFMKRQFSGQR